MAMGNNNCQIKIKEIKMGPADPGMQSSADSDEKKEMQLESSAAEQDEDKKSKNAGEERSSITEADL